MDQMFKKIILPTLKGCSEEGVNDDICKTLSMVPGNI